MTFQSQCPTLVKLSETKPPNKNLKHWLQARDTTEKEGPASGAFSADKKTKNITQYFRFVFIFV